MTGAASYTTAFSLVTYTFALTRSLLITQSRDETVYVHREDLKTFFFAQGRINKIILLDFYGSRRKMKQKSI